mmetsp:Transcript_15424/g.28021  ORF Transcript_15424/g.28021 Transcript_15424/m.28021 type:complete len:181 (-) Transcript_15424:56-598(-)
MQNMPRSKSFRGLLIFLLLHFSSVVAVSSSPTEKIIRNSKYRDMQKNNGAIVSHHDVQNPTLTKEVSFLPVVYVSIINSVINTIRPDRAIIWQARVPRALWEICIVFVAKSANNTFNPSVCLLLCLMTIPTALMDIFIWAPSFVMLANFETCTGGGILSRQPKVCTSDYVKGVGRLFVSF